MGFGEAIKEGYRNYFNFSGRATRSAFWWFWLWYILILGIMLALLVSGVMLQHQHAAGALPVLLLGGVFALAVLGNIIPIFSAQVRRLHDAGHSGWWVGAMILLILLRDGLRVVARHHPDDGMMPVVLVLLGASFVVDIAVFIFYVQPSRIDSRYRRY